MIYDSFNDVPDGVQCRPIEDRPHSSEYNFKYKELWEGAHLLHRHAIGKWERQDLTNNYDHISARLSDTEKHRDRLIELLKAAQCPQCDGPPEELKEISRCRFCGERAAEVAACEERKAAFSTSSDASDDSINRIKIVRSGNDTFERIRKLEENDNEPFDYWWDRSPLLGSGYDVREASRTVWKAAIAWYRDIGKNKEETK